MKTYFRSDLRRFGVPIFLHFLAIGSFNLSQDILCRLRLRRRDLSQFLHFLPRDLYVACKNRILRIFASAGSDGIDGTAETCIAFNGSLANAMLPCDGLAGGNSATLTQFFLQSFSFRLFRMSIFTVVAVRRSPR
jgi:hypothetical protein